MPGFKGAAAKEHYDSKRDFLPNSISSNTELMGRDGIGSSKSSYAASILETLDALESRELFETLRTLCEQGGSQILKGVEI